MSKYTIADPDISGSLTIGNTWRAQPSGLDLTITRVSDDLEVARINDSTLGLEVAEEITAQAVRIRGTADPLVDARILGPGTGGTSYDLQLPTDPPASDNQILLWDSSGVASFADFYNTPTNILTVRKDPLPGQYSDISTALAAITSPSTTNRWIVDVFPGDYTITSGISVPTYAYLRGNGLPRIIQSGTGYDLVTLSGNFAAISDLELYGFTSDGTKWALRNSAAATRANTLRFTDCTHCIYSAGTFAITSISIAGILTSVVRCGLYTGAQTSSIVAIRTAGQIAGGFQITSSAGINMASIDLTGTGNGFEVSEGARLQVTGGSMTSWAAAIYTPATHTTTAPKVYTSSIFFNSCTLNFNLLDPDTIGWHNGYTEYTRSVLPSGTSFFVANKDRFIITVSAAGSDFTSIYTAMQSITDNSSTRQYTILVSPGTYTEPPIVMKDYTSIVGTFQSTTNIVASSTTGTLITGASYSGVSRVTLTGATGSGGALIGFAGNATNTNFRFSEITFGSAETLVRLRSTSGGCIAIGTNLIVGMASVFTTAFDIEDDGTNPLVYYLDRVSWYPDGSYASDFSHFLRVKSNWTDSGYALNGTANGLIATNLTGSAVGTGIEVSGQAQTLFTNCTSVGFSTGFSAPNTATYPFIVMSGSVFEYNTTDINIQNSGATGSILARADAEKIICVTDSIGINILDDNGGGISSGTFYLGDTYSKATNVSRQIQNASSVGILGDYPTLEIDSDLDIAVGAGQGYLTVQGASLIQDYLRYITWSSTIVTVTASATSWIAVDSSGSVVVLGSQPDYRYSVVLAMVHSSGSTVDFISPVGNLISNHPSAMDIGIAGLLECIFKSGCLVTVNSGLTLNCSSGVYYHGTSRYDVSSATGITFIGYYSAGSTSLNATPLQWDSSGTLTAITSTKWIRHDLYLTSGRSGTPTFLLIYGNTQYDSQILAEAAGLLATPSWFSGNNIVALASLLVTSGSTTTEEIIDIRPRLSYHVSSSSGSTDHNSLTNLTVGDAHPQYFRNDGTHAMTGNLDLGGNNITNAGLVDGVTISSHSARHLPGGADALATAAPVSIGTSNLTGVAASFSRSDHQHSHGTITDSTAHSAATSGAAGFMSAADKTKLDASTSSATASAIAQRDSSGNCHFGVVGVSTGSFTASLTGAAGGAADCIVTVPNTTSTLATLATAQAFTNKTITDSTNTVHATHLRTTGSSAVVVGSTAPTLNQVLVATNSTTASWQSLTPAMVSAPYAYVSDTKASGTAGGALAAGVNVRTLNTYSSSGMTLNSSVANQFGLSTGTYLIEGSVPGNRCAGHIAEIYNVTTATSAGFGCTNFANVANMIQNLSTFRRVVTVSAATEFFQIRHWANSARADAAGLAASIVGVSEVYTQVFIRKLA
jgi:hypothetical protein